VDAHASGEPRLKGEEKKRRLSLCGAVVLPFTAPPRHSDIKKLGPLRGLCLLDSSMAGEASGSESAHDIPVSRQDSKITKSPQYRSVNQVATGTSNTPTRGQNINAREGEAVPPINQASLTWGGVGGSCKTTATVLVIPH
jgi:hypothetical protein